MAIPTSTAINYSNLFTQSHANVFNLLNNRSNVPDPIDSLGTRKFVYVREPRNLAVSFDGFPVVIVHSAEMTQENLTVDSTKSTIEFSITVSIWAKDAESPKTGTASGAERMDTITDNVMKTLNNKANRTTLRNYGLKDLNINSANMSYDD